MTYSKKPRFNINFILQETGLKADTVRAWERRYQIPQPERSKGGHRLYSEYDLHTLIWLMDRQNDGMRIGQAAAYWHEQSSEGLDPLASVLEPENIANNPLVSTQNATLEDLQTSWLEHSFQFNEIASEQILSLAFAQYPVQTVCTELILPGLGKVGDLWANDEISVQQEHFISEVTVRKLQTLISTAPHPTHNQSILIANPPGEHHVIILLMLTLLLKNRGWQVIYLGGNVPNADLLKTVNLSKIDLVILSASRLITSTALKDTINLLLSNGTPAAYGGWIFSQSERLAESFPGLYLGNDLCQSINTVEDFLNNPKPLPSGSKRDESSEKLAEELKKAEPQIIQTINDNMLAESMIFEPDIINTATRDLIADITAALNLGNIDHTLINLDWISNLITNRNFPNTALQTYLSVFSQAIEKHMGTEAQRIIRMINNHSLR